MDRTPSDLRRARTDLLANPELSGAALREALTDVTDRWLADLLGDEPAVALIAVGGYGRREPAAGSDLDLVLLHRGRKDIAEVAERLWYPVWDCGVPLDHSVRTAPEAVAVAAGDLKAALGLLDARHVAGDPELSAEVRSRCRQQWRARAASRLPELRAAGQERAQRFGELPFLLEPDVKEARGGLRDVHALQAIAAAWAANPPDGAVLDAYRLLLDVRGELHRRRTGRGADRLLLQEQGGLAARLGYGDADDLLTDVSSAGRAISFTLDETWRRALATVRPVRRRLSGPGRGPARRPLADGVVSQDGEVVLSRDAEPASDSTLLLRAAAAAAVHDLPLSVHTLDRFCRFAAPLPEPWPADALHFLVALLGAGEGTRRVMEALDQAGLLVALLPEWQAVRCRPQRNPLHRHTVDRHLVETVIQAASAVRTVSRPDLLLLGALLHDIGKGWPGDHSIAGARVVAGLAPRLGLPPEDAAVLEALVRHHLLLPDTATRRDLDDPATVATVVDAVDGSTDVLRLLHALTEADGTATGPAAWTEWKASLVAALVDRAAHALSGAASPAPAGPTASDRELAARGVVAVEYDGRRVTVVAPQHSFNTGPEAAAVRVGGAGTLWRSAGALALHRLDVRAATVRQLQTPHGFCTVATFDVTVRFGSAPRAELLCDDVRRALAGTLPLEQRLRDRERSYSPARRPAAAPTVSFFDDASTSATVLEVHTPDAEGALYRICRALDDVELVVTSARIATLGAEVVDAFYITTAAGERLPFPERQRVREVVLGRLGDSNAG
ncbi:MAG: [protein-PII] uridylyltransferase [Actinomycetota bacterium]|nr:[protein-PII] uridylyltransferase [Actinomycetota bacterium]